MLYCKWNFYSVKYIRKYLYIFFINRKNDLDKSHTCIHTRNYYNDEFALV